MKTFLPLFLLHLLIPFTYSQTYDLILKRVVDHPFIAFSRTVIDDSKWYSVKTEANQFDKDTILLVAIPPVPGISPVVVKMRQPTTLNADKTVSFEFKLVQPNDSFCSKQWWVPQPISPVQIAWMVVELGAYNMSSYTLIVGKGTIFRRSWSTTATVTNGNLISIWFPTGCVSSTEFCVLSHASRGAINLLQTDNNVKEAGKTLYLSVRSRQIDQRRGQWVLVPHDVAAGVTSYHVLTNETLGYLAFPNGIAVACLERMVFETYSQQTNYIPKTIKYKFTYAYPPGLFGMVGTITSLCDTILKSPRSNATTGTFAIYEDQCAKAEFIHTTIETIFLMVIGELQTTTSTYECKVNFDSALDPTSSPTRVPTFSPSSIPTFAPTRAPSTVPTLAPTRSPSVNPSAAPSFVPSVNPSAAPSFIPTLAPTRSPSVNPSTAPSFVPSVNPSAAPSFVPSVNPSSNPTFAPSSSPTVNPTLMPTGGPTYYPTYFPSANPSSTPTFVPSLSPSTSPSFVPTRIPSNSPSTSPTIAPTTSPSTFPTCKPSTSPSYHPTHRPTIESYCIQIFLWDSFGDYWDNLQFVVRAKDGSFEYIYQKSCNCSDVLDICFPDPHIDYTMTIEEIDPSKPVRHGWEAFFKYVDPFTGKVYYGQQGSIIRIHNTEVFYAIDMVNTDPEAEVNQCQRCEHPPKPKPSDDKPSSGDDDKRSNGDDDSKGPKPDALSSSPVHHRSLGSKSNSSDDDNGNGGGGKNKPKRPPLRFPFALFDEDGDGWYIGGNGTDEVCPGVPESTMPSVITYPRYSIVSGDRTTLIHEGTICGSFSTEACVEVLPYDGRFVFRVGGFDRDPSEVTWDFCGEKGMLGEELEFQMVKGKCVAVEKRSADDYCKGIESISVWSGSLLLTSSSTFSSSSISVEDSKVFERTLSEVLFHSEVQIGSMIVNDNGLVVSFTALIILEKLGYMGVYYDEVEKAEEYITTSFQNDVSNGVVFASLESALSSDPSMTSGVVGQATSLILLEFEMTALEYRTRSNSNANGNGLDDGNKNDADEGSNDMNNDNNNQNDEKDSVMEELQHFSMIGYVTGAAGLLLIALVVVKFAYPSSETAEASSEERTQLVHEQSSHSLHASSKHEVVSKYVEDEVFRFRHSSS